MTLSGCGVDAGADGGRTRACRTDPSYLPDTSATMPTGAALDAETVPFAVRVGTERATQPLLSN
jgi:hypothetical protein